MNYENRSGTGNKQSQVLLLIMCLCTRCTSEEHELLLRKRVRANGNSV